ncbi:MAG: 4-(cytidine 5'-diphospho)-2-C-methyl-D-erythritol kinase [Clostridia bacterium]|nr:4-(cytidine 5'-diphospho)-2-C-methyl-D-erythritol kinase [Clostridia bacterium]
MKVTYKAAAKINLMLDIIATLPNGYHSLFMVMQSVSLFDKITVEKTSDGGIVLSSNEPAIPCDETNIAHKAAVAFYNFTEIEDRNISIHIEKHIPFAAGLAGGSADGAGVIAALNEIYETGLTERELCAIGVKVGADVPFCLTGGTRLAQNIGEVLSPLPDLKDCYIVLAKPDIGVATGPAYAEFDKHGVRHLDTGSMLFAAANGDFEAVCAKTGNVFEQLIEVPQRVPIKSVMYENGAVCACMSGSGPTVFGIFNEKENAEKAMEQLKEKYSQVYLCQPVNSGVIKE